MPLLSNVPLRQRCPILFLTLNRVPGEVRNKFYGCGFPIPLGIEGLNVLDLGSGAGRDCYVVANLVSLTRIVLLKMPQLGLVTEPNYVALDRLARGDSSPALT